MSKEKFDIKIEVAKHTGLTYEEVLEDWVHLKDTLMVKRMEAEKAGEDFMESIYKAYRKDLIKRALGSALGWFRKARGGIIGTNIKMPLEQVIIQNKPNYRVFPIFLGHMINELPIGKLEIDATKLPETPCYSFEVGGIAFENKDGEITKFQLHEISLVVKEK